MDALTLLDQRVAALEKKVEEEIDRLYNKELPAIDAEIHRAITNSYETGDKAAARVDAGVAEARAVTNELSKFVHDKIAVTVRDLIAQSNSATVVAALREALKSQVIVTRPANRHDKPEDVIAVRQAPSQSRS